MLPRVVRGSHVFPEHGRSRTGAASSSERSFPMVKNSTKSTRCKKNPPGWHAAFEKMIPVIEEHARISFRHLDDDALEEAIQAVVCNCCQAYARLVKRGKTDVAHASVLATFAVAQARDGRKVGNRLNIHDVSSDYCQKRKNIIVERLDRPDLNERSWSEVLVEDRHAGPADTAIMRIDFAAWMKTLSRRLQKIAMFLANGETTTAASKRFRIAQCRISQIRRQLFESWHTFQGDMPALA